MCTKIKYLLMILILAGFTAQYAAAENFNQQDMAFAFGDSAVAASDFGQMDVLSSQEMMVTEGQVFWFGYLGYLASVMTIDVGLQAYFYGVYVPWWQRSYR